MFLVYAPIGAFWPLFSLRLKKLGFTPLEIALASAVQAVGSLFAPLFAGQFADRWLPAERCLALFSFLSAALLWVMAGCTSPAELALVGLAFWLLMAPMMPLANTISFTHLAAPEDEFGSVRLWGTAGWVVLVWIGAYALWEPAWLLALMERVRPENPRIGLDEMFRLAAGAAVVLGCYALTLPRTPPRHHAPAMFAPLAALRLLRRRDFALYFACILVLFLTVPFASQNTVLLLDELGISNAWKGPALTIAQVTEVLSLLVLPRLMAWLGQRRIMILGGAAWVASLIVLTIGSPAALVIGSLAFNGLFITGFIVAGQVFVNSQAAPDIRASAQALISFTAGVGMLAGYAISGAVAHLAHGAFRPTFAVAALLALLTMIVFTARFHPERTD
jgi:MFS family permease